MKAFFKAMTLKMEKKQMEVSKKATPKGQSDYKRAEERKEESQLITRFLA